MEFKAKLDKADRIILSELDRNCRVPASRLARLARKSRQSVEYRIRRLVGEGIITSFNAAINPHKMGYKIYKLYLQLRNIPERRKALFSHLRASGSVYWMGECDGVWDLIFGVFCESDRAFYDLKNRVISDFADIIVRSDGDIYVDVMQYPKMYFTGELRAPAMFAGTTVQNGMDRLDHAILAEMVNNARIPLTELASKMRSSPPTVSARLRRMESLGIIIQYRIGVDLGKLGLEMYKAIIYIDRYTAKDEKELLAYISSIPNVQYYIRNIWTMEPEFVVAGYHEYYGIMNGLKMRFPRVIRNVESVLLKSDEWTPGFRNLLESKGR